MPFGKSANGAVSSGAALAGRILSKFKKLNAFVSTWLEVSSNQSPPKLEAPVRFDEAATSMRVIVANSFTNIPPSLPDAILHP